MHPAKTIHEACVPEPRFYWIEQANLPDIVRHGNPRDRSEAVQHFLQDILCRQWQSSGWSDQSKIDTLPRPPEYECVYPSGLWVLHRENVALHMSVEPAWRRLARAAIEVQDPALDGNVRAQLWHQTT